MAGVRINARDLGATLRGQSAMLRDLASQVRAEIPAIAKEELGKAVRSIRRVSPVKTGRFKAGWNVERRALIEFAVSTDPVDERGRHYGSFVHRKGERGWPFWEAHALPRVEAARDRINERVQTRIRERVLTAGGRVVSGRLMPSRSLVSMGRFGL